MSHLLGADGSLFPFFGAYTINYHNDSFDSSFNYLEKSYHDCAYADNNFKSYYVSASLREKISRERCIHASIPLSRDVRQPSFYRNRLQTIDGGFPRLDYMMELAVESMNVGFYISG